MNLIVSGLNLFLRELRVWLESSGLCPYTSLPQEEKQADANARLLQISNAEFQMPNEGSLEFAIWHLHLIKENQV